MPDLMLSAALRYAAGGHRVFPIRLRPRWERAKPPAPPDGWDKVPPLHGPRKGGWRNPDPARWQRADRGGFHQASCRADLVRGLWAAAPGASVGYALPPDRVAVDIDGQGCLERLPADLRRLLEGAETLIIGTPGHQGWHVYWQLPPGVEVRQTAARGISRLPADHIRRIVDIRACGKGLCVLPPSGHEWGSYATLRGSLDRLEMMPEEWIDALNAEAPASPAPAREPRPAPAAGGGMEIGRARASLRPGTYGGAWTDAMEQVMPPDGRRWPDGTGRHPMLLPAASAMRETGWDREVARRELHGMNERLWERPKDADLVDGLIDDVWARYGGGE